MRKQLYKRELKTLMLTNSSENEHDKQLAKAIEKEAQKFQTCYSWLKKSVPSLFLDEIAKQEDNISLIVHSLIGFDLQGYFSIINIKGAAIVMCLDSPDADLKILKNFATFGISNYEGYVSSVPPPLHNCTSNLRISVIHFTEAFSSCQISIAIKNRDQIAALVQARNPLITSEVFDKLISQINSSFVSGLTIESLVLAIEMFYRTKTRDNCQYEVRYNENWQRDKAASMQIVLAWKNTPKYNFLYQIATVIHRHKLIMKKVSATYIDPYSKESVLLMVLDLHSSEGKAAWDVTNTPDFLRELATVKYFYENDSIETHLVNKGIVSGNNGNLLRAMASFIQQLLVHLDPNLYTLDRIKEDFCRHPEFAVKLVEAFAFRFHPEFHNETQFLDLEKQFKQDLDKLDTGIEENDARRKNVLGQAFSLIKHTLKTNFFRINYTAISFRLDPTYLNELPFDRKDKFPILPYAIFFIKGMHFFGYHIRFKNLSRGGLRTVYLEQSEYLQQESNNVFIECYNLALTQHFKNKDIPEGGAKAIIFLKPWDQLDSEALILENEMIDAEIGETEIRREIDSFRKEQKEEYLHQAQRSFIESLITIINCDPNGRIRARYIVDYWKQPEYLYLGPDENMHDTIIEWIADFSKRYNYKPGSAFISGKPERGINHKEYGVTSLGVNVYMEKVLFYLGIDPYKDLFSVKLSGGPDGDVAGNEIVNLAHHYPHTAKLIALTDVSGCIYDPNGLELPLLVHFFKSGKPIKHYPPENLSEGGYLLDRYLKRSPTPFVQQTLCWKKVDGILEEHWLSGSEMNHLWRSNVHHIKADIFITAGGRPRALNESNIKDFLDEQGAPTARAIVEGANLYLSPGARRYLEKLGTLIIKDSSANKTGVICSSFEVLIGLAIGDERFLEQKKIFVAEILDRLRSCAANEANLLLETHKTTGEFLTAISAAISDKINLYTYELLDYLDPLPLSHDLNDLLIRCFFDYCLPTLCHKYAKELMEEIPDHHKKAIISCHLASEAVYKRGIHWSPSIIDILPVLLEDVAKS